MKLVQNLDDFEKLFHHLCYNEIRIAPEEHPFLILEKLFTCKESREQLTTLLFETFDVAGLSFLPQEFALLHASKNQCGIVVNLGHSQTTVVPIWKGNILRDIAQVLDLGGNDIVESLQLMLQHKNSDLKPSISKEIMKTTSYVAMDYETELKKSIDQVPYELPDGQILPICQERFVCTEMLFNPGLFGVNGNGLQDAIMKVRQELTSRDLKDRQCSRDLILGPIILGGGLAVLPGLSERLSAYIPGVQITVVPKALESIWIGGSALAHNTWLREQGLLEGMYLMKREYDEYGPTLIHSKCL